MTEPSQSSPDSTVYNENKTIEEIYQKKTQLEHILLRPDSYIGSIEAEEQEMWVFDSEEDTIKKKKIKYVPGLYKIVDEILVNAADNKVTTQFYNTSI
jgi:DNA topoisomerase-2